MMNKSKIDWCDFTWNPVTGCRRGCPYCYARRQAHRFTGDKRINITDLQLQAEDGPDGKIYTLAQPFRSARGQIIPFPAGFEPTLHEYRLGDVAAKKKPGTIFVCSMGDLFAPSIPDEWIDRVFDACKAAPQHNYLFLTKYPDRYCALADAGKLPEANDYPGFWFGTTVTKQGDPFFGESITYNVFLSIEPISGSLDAGLGSFGGVRWIIVGAETGNRPGKITPQRAWIENVIEAASITHAHVLLKDSAELRAVWGDELVQEFPEALRPMPGNDVPHCKTCEHADKERQGLRGEAIRCRIGYTDATGAPVPRTAPGRYTRTSPPWCPLRHK